VHARNRIALHLVPVYQYDFKHFNMIFIFKLDHLQVFASSQRSWHTTYSHKYTLTNTFTHTHTHTLLIQTRTNTHKHAHQHTHTYKNTHAHTRTHTHKRTHKRTRMQTNTQTHVTAIRWIEGQVVPVGTSVADAVVRCLLQHLT